MTNKQFNFPNTLKPIQNNAYGKNGVLKSSGLSAIIADNRKATENHFLLRLQEIERINANLENLLKQGTVKLNEVVATNSKFISIIAHDLRSPFVSILNILEVLKDSLNDYDINEIERYINTVSNSATRTLSLLDNLLAWTISQNKEKSFHPVKINLHTLLVDELDSISVSAQQKQIMLNNSITPGLNVSGDIQMIKTIFRNLIGNALKFTNTGGEISFNASEVDLFVEIAIKDNGMGISYEAQKELFKSDVFHSTEGTNHEQGTGLGLLLCKEFVEIHGGIIHVESEPGKGCEFKFTLPHYI